MNLELASFSDPGAGGDDSSVVLVDETPDERETQAEAAALPGRDFALAEWLEDVRKVLGSDADARVDDTDDGIAVAPVERDVNRRSGLAVLHRVVEEIPEDLRQPGRVAHHEEGPGHFRQNDLAGWRTARGFDAIDDLSHGVHQVDALQANRRLPGSNSRHVEKLVDDPSDLQHLVVDDPSQFRPLIVVPGHHVEGMRGARDRTERVA